MPIPLLFDDPRRARTAARRIWARRSGKPVRPARPGFLQRLFTGRAKPERTVRIGGLTIHTFPPF